jgi:hypothetical protein
MDQGPVDAGPSELHGPRRAESPEEQHVRPRARSTAPARPAASSSSAAAAAAGDVAPDASRSLHVPLDTSTADAESQSQKSTSDCHHRTHSNDSLASANDPPLYYRVGATAEEVAGHVNLDHDEHMKDPDDAHQVRDHHSHPHRMHKFVLYETNARYWITGSDITERAYRLLRIDRTSPPGHITLFEDETVYDRRQMNDVLNAIDQGNKTTGGLRLKYSFWGLLGFIRFTDSYYMLLITKREQTAMIGGHYVYRVNGTELVPLTTGSSSSFLRDRNPEEGRFLGILNNLDLTKSFYFSYSYDLTHSLQRNIIRAREALNEGLTGAGHDYNGMFVWNSHLLKPAVQALKHPYDWCLPIIHGFLQQAALDIFGRTVYICIIGRRSRFFAGARFLKRGVNDQGYVANDVETEQIVADKLTTSFHAPGPRLFASPNYTSYLHHRGSIPLYWTQDNSGVTPKPGIDINLSDPFYQPAALHFDNLFARYGCPVYVLNLVKAREKTPRESKLLYEYQKCVEYLNQSLPEDKRMIYKAYDMARAAKTRNGDVIGGLEVIAREIVAKTGFFHNGEAGLWEARVQNGIARTNCIDCLDRTNAAQFVIGKHVFAQQLKALGVISTDEVEYDTDAVNLFTNMFHDHGDNIAMQYGGSHLVNTMATYRKVGAWQNSSRDMVESFKRYYHNSFLDSQRQEAYNLFLGNYIWAAGQPMLWDLATDYYLHHSDPRRWLERHRRHYIDWYTPEHLEDRIIPPRIPHPRVSQELVTRGVRNFDDYWRECYRPTALSSLQKVYSFRMNSTNRYLPERPYADNKHDFSPFVRRIDSHKPHDSPEKARPRKGVKIVDPHEAPPTDTASEVNVPRPSTGNPLNDDNDMPTSILREARTFPSFPDDHGDHPTQSHDPTRPLHHPSDLSHPSQSLQSSTSTGFQPADKAQTHLWTLNQFHSQSLNPYVSPAEEAEYTRYISHPTNIPLVVSTELPSDANIDYVEYIAKAGVVMGDDDGDDEDDDGGGGGGTHQGISEEDIVSYWDFIQVQHQPQALTVLDDDLVKKRYKAYRQWLRGKSLFKQSKVDPEYRA